MRTIAREPELAATGSPHVPPNELFGAFNHFAGEITSEDARQRQLRESSKDDTDVTRIHACSLNAYERFSVLRPWIRKIADGERVERTGTVDLQCFHGYLRNVSTMDKSDEFREEVEAADATGMVANQELLATFPAETLHQALPPAHHAHTTIDQLKAELGKAKPNRAAVEKHVQTLTGVQELEAAVGRWWNSPTTQRILVTLAEFRL